MKIIHLVDDHHRVLLGCGSVPTVIWNIAKYTSEKGHEVTILERRWKGLNYEEKIKGIRFKRFDLKICSNIPLKDQPYRLIKSPLGLTRFILDRVDFAIKLNKYLKKEDFDVIHVHVPFAANILINLNKDLRNKMIYTAHVGEEKKRFALDSSSPLLLKLFSPDLYLMKRIKKSVVLNEPLKDKLVKRGIKEDKLEVIPNGVSVEEFNVSNEEMERVKKRYGLEEDKVTVMFAGTITPRKGIVYLIKAAKILLEEEYKVKFILCGNTSLELGYVEEVKEIINSYNLPVELTGIVPYDDLKALYSACDVFVLPSFEEGHGITLTEAMASGKPLIGTKVGGIPAQIKDGWNGFLVEPGNEKQLAEKIRYLIDNPEERERMGENSRKLAREEFDWKKIAERYLKVYEEVAE